MEKSENLEETIMKNLDPGKDSETILNISKMISNHKTEVDQLKEQLKQKDNIINQNNSKYDTLRTNYENLSDEYRRFLINGVSSSKGGNQQQNQQPETIQQWFDNFDK